MDPEFVAAVARVAAGEKINVARFCREHDIARDTFYKYLARFRVEGTDGLLRRSTAPHHSPAAVTAEVTEAVLRARNELADEGLDNGPISIGWRLEERGCSPLPSRVSIYRILVTHGQITPQPRKKPRTRRRFEYTDPNGCWQIDGMEHYLADGTEVCILQILDDHSRLDVGSYAAVSENGTDTWTALQQAFAGHGLPVKVLSDNGLAFSGKHRGRMVELERHLASHGVTTIASSVYHPQTCGKVERHHQTLKRWLACQPTQPATLEQLQTLLEAYREYYNTRRRHSALGRRTPHHAWNSADHLGGPQHLPVQDDATIHYLKVSATGTINLGRGHRIRIGTTHATQTITVINDHDRATAYTSNGDPIGYIHLDHTKTYQGKLTPAA
jgi:transposase InsO family protein